MHMDDSKKPISSNELNLQPASDRPSAVDELPADFASSHNIIARERQPPSDQITPWRNDHPSSGASVAVYCGSEEEVREGFLIALNAMGVAVVEEPAEAAQPLARGKP
jgi:hypothetical protein